MRTALGLLLLLALAAVPGSLVPQEARQPAQAADFRKRYPDLAPLLGRPGFFDVYFFDVYVSPWFAAVYLLPFISPAGCIVPRARPIPACPVTLAFSSWSYVGLSGMRSRSGDLHSTQLSSLVN
ncbi:cytochrome c biogenesis protein ResB [Streptomyces sp. 2A115]|uniref:cytochrome c biogenesis protein ResB n=1 Tax=Streptomyces sp. 2A115 TaxID=3457439 RepID=UPI003FD086BA